MSRRKRDAISPTLFPFLAVLVCTLGTLILFLALVAQKAKTTAERTAERAPADPNRLTAAAVDAMIEEEHFRADHLVSLRDAQTADLERRRDELTHLEDQMIKLKEKLNALRDEVEEATKKNSNTAVDPNTLVMLKDELAKEEARVRELEESVATAQPRVIIVPHKGPNGTDRRAVYLECTRDGVKIWPEGVMISQVQLADTTRDANPLDAALRTIRYHARQHYGDQTAPYPLLVVRPDGTETYAMARVAMQDSDDQFGYELVPGEIDLAFPDPDPELKERIEVAIRKSAIRQHVRYAGLGGGRGDNDGSPDDRRLRGGSGGAFGGSGSDDDEVRSNRYVADGDAAGSGGSTGDARPRRRLPTLSAADLDRQGKARGYQSFEHADVAGAYDPRSELDRLVDNIPDRARQSGFGESGPEPTDDVAEKMAANYSNDPPSIVGPASASGSPASSDRSPSDTADPTRASSTNSAPVQSLASGSSAATPARPSSMSTRPPGEDSSEDRSASPQPSTSVNMTPRQRPTVRREGKDWALPDSVARSRGTEIVRPIRLRCYHDRFVLVDTVNPSSSLAFRFNGDDVRTATLEMATAVRDRVETWGASLPGGRWQPRLEVEVMPHGEQRFHQLRTFMTGSGVEVRAAAPRHDARSEPRSP